MLRLMKIITVRVLVTMVVSLSFLGSVNASGTSPLKLTLKQGKTANYGATPWYTDDISVGTSALKFALDSGARFTWATSDKCTSNACKPHQSVDTSQPGFIWIDPKKTTRNFGPWGSMITETGGVFGQASSSYKQLSNSPFYAAVDYQKDQFKYLAWDGGIGFPSRSDTVKSDNSFYFADLLRSGAITDPSFSVVTHPKTKLGTFYLGGDDPSQYNSDSLIELQPNTSGVIPYIWGTDLYSGYLFEPGDLPLLNNIRFYLDTGASVFKGDSIYFLPILEKLYAIKDIHGKRIFKKVLDNGQWVSLVYQDPDGPAKYAEILPDFNLIIGQKCSNQEGKSARISLSPEQYSYKVEVGAQKGQWVVAFTVLDGVGGFLVGSTFMDLFYTTFKYQQDGNTLTQGDIHLHTKKTGTKPAQLSCVVQPSPPPLVGTWYNSYCSQVSLDVEKDSGKISGTYTSHTGSVGSSSVVGWLGASKKAIKLNQGTPFSMGIQWRAINEKVDKENATWHWVSTFSGQYFPAQVIQEKGQSDYTIDETIELLNGLVATANMPGYTDHAPVMWPQTLTFTRNPPSYCQPIVTPTEVHYAGTSKDYVTGAWEQMDGSTMLLRANMQTGKVSGEYFDSNKTLFTVTGLVDMLAIDTSVAAQGVTLTMRAPSSGKLISMAGGVNLNDKKIMELWQADLTSTTWTGRFSESTLDKKSWKLIMHDQASSK